jgi:predicted phosphodiesterase
VRLAIFSDAHGNIHALERCLVALDRLDADQRLFLGDAVGYFPCGRECVDLLSAGGFECQQGNHEAMLLGLPESRIANDAVYRLTETRSELPGDMVAVIAEWPQSRVVEPERILCVHGTPDQPLDGYAYPDSDLSSWARLPYAAVFTGNTHRPFARREGPVLVANAGSVGLPRDVGNLACFMIYDTSEQACTHYRVRLDTDALLDQLGDRIHDSVRECMQRRADRFVGELAA